MAYALLKVMLTAVLVVLVSEVAKRSSLLGAVLASVPLVSVLGMIWLYVDTGDSARVASLAGSIFWLVLPSLALFLVLPPLLRHGVGFYLSLLLAVAATVLCYALTVWMLQRWGG